jgi:hypothetical protein
LHALNQEARKAGGLSPALLAKHVIANEEDETLVSAIALTGQAALNYEFFAALTGEVEKREKSGDKAGAQRLGQIRDQLLEMQREMQEATQQVLQEAQATLNEILSAENLEEAVAANMGRIDDAFMHVLEARLIHAEQSGHQDQVDKLQRVQQAIMTQLQGETPPEVRLITQLVSAPDKGEREKLMAASANLISGELVQIVELLRDQSANAGQKELADRLGEIWAEINAQVMAAGG